MKRPRSDRRSFERRIAVAKARLEAEAADFPPGPFKDELLKKIRQLETANQVNEWLSSPRLQPPT